MTHRLPVQLFAILRQPAFRSHPGHLCWASTTSDNLADASSRASEVLRDATSKQRVRMPGPFPDGMHYAGGEAETKFRDLGFGRKSKLSRCLPLWV